MIRKDFIKKVFIDICVFGSTVLASLTSSKDDDFDLDNDYTNGDDGSIKDSAELKQHPILPAKAFLWLYDHWGENAAEEVSYKVKIGEMSINEVETNINRPDINPNDWSYFEDGWRRSGW